jgi:hypothetical protein
MGLHPHAQRLGARDVSSCAGFSDAGYVDASHALVRPASEKRQGTKSRLVRHRRCGGLYGDLTGVSGWAVLD